MNWVKAAAACAAQQRDYFIEAIRERNTNGASMKIDDEHVLPCDFVVGHIRFGKGVKLETVRGAAERWLNMAANSFQPDQAKMKALDQMLADTANSPADRKGEA